MNLVKLFLTATLFSLIFSFSGCQGNNSDSPETNTTSTTTNLPPVVDLNTSTSSVTVVLPVSSTILTINNQVVSIAIRVFDSANNPYSTGLIKKVNPSDVLAGRDIGTFSPISEAPLVDGIATFTYTAPDNLEVNTSNISFGFYHDSNSSDIKTYTMSIVPDTNQTVFTSYVLKSSNPTDVNMDLESTKQFSYSVFDAAGVVLPDTDITKITVASLNPSLAILKDTFGTTGSVLSIDNQNGFTINLVSNTLSGLVPIKVDATFKDANGDDQNLSEIFNTVVFSGPPTAASLGYIGTAFNPGNGLYTEQWRLMVTDTYSNLVNSNPAVSTNMLVGYALSSAATSNAANYLHFDTTPGGTMATNAGKGQFTAPAGVFSNVDLVNDNLVIFGTGYNFNTFGKWDINSISPTVLELSDDFNGSTTTGLGFAVGHNLRNETCTNNSTVASIKAKDNNNILNDDGIIILEATYNDYMVGKSVILSTNFVGGHNNLNGQLGYAEKITFVGTGLTSGVYIVKEGSSIGVKRIYVYVNDSPHGITLRSANFGAIVEVTAKDTNAVPIGSSMDNGITYCDPVIGGAAYVDVNITSLAGGDGTITLTDLKVGSEF